MFAVLVFVVKFLQVFKISWLADIEGSCTTAVHDCLIFSLVFSKSQVLEFSMF